MSHINNYLNIVKDKLTFLAEDQQQNINQVANKLADVIRQGGIIYFFGCGHSHIFGEDVFYRAGGLAPVRPILIEPLMLHEGAARSSKLEKQNNYILPYLVDYKITEKDALIVISTSGINPVPIDVAQWGRQHGAYTVAITSSVYADTFQSKHTSGQHLRDCADQVIDNNVPIGDAVLKASEQEPPFSPISSMLGIFLVQGIFAEVIFNLSEEQCSLPIFLSGNIPDSDKHNLDLINQYGGRIPELINGL
ncbi:SIS domain-containing protein [Providencia stuartii]|uniref:SIS domain-containing protein n=1 Tax=Providencia stuartii TaxID=588 RepID=A0A1S1HPV1_PROST|nr:MULTISPECIES: SIS domain-containing protein [Providencia]ELR5300985.1 SIS domain-containing protein [Providencia stuartii]MDV5226521.1 SIS domain-containing protein [Providencia rettgeri]MDW7587938.1 SIS domain-containing protein [Providencia sp. 2023EL-00965]OHT23441.1 SIS domain-containing protein [Providencia stuartii]